MKNLKKYIYSGIVVGLLAIAFSVYAAGTPISVPSAPTTGYMLLSKSTGAYIASSTQTAYFGNYIATSTRTSIFPYASTTALSSPYASSTQGYFGTLNLLGITGTQCLHSISGVVSGTGSDCGSGGGTFPFTSVAGYNSTSTVLGLLNGFFSTASSTISGNFYTPNLSQGFLYVGSAGLHQTVASSSINISSLNNDLANLTATNGSLTFTGNYNGSVARTVGLNVANTNTWSVLQNFNYSSTTGASSSQWASSTAEYIGTLNLPSITGTQCLHAISGVVSGTGSDCGAGGGGISNFTAGTGLLGGLINTSGLTIYSQVGTSSLPVIGQIPYWTGLGGTANPATLGTVATGTISNGTGISVTANQYVIGSGLTITNTSPLSGMTTTWPLSFSNPALSWVGLATSSNLVNGRVHYSTGVNTFADVATSSIASGVGITVTNGSTSFVIGAQPSVACNTASASVFGCLNTSDFSKFNSATTTFSTGLTYTGATNAVTVNTSQSIATLSNLTSNGYVKTSGGAGTLSVQGVPIPIADGGTNSTTYPSNTLMFYNGTSILATSSAPLYIGSLYSTSTLTNILLNPFTGFGTTTPFAQLQIATTSANAGFKPQVVLSDANGGTNAKHWYVDSEAGVFDIGTTSDTGTYATSSAFTISAPTTASPGTTLGVASTSPWRTLSITGTVAFDGLTSSTAGNAVCILSTKDIVTAGNTTCVTSSKYTKHDILSISQSTAEEIMSLRPVQYVNNEGGDARYGFIAEEVFQIDPKLIETAQTTTVLDGHTFKKGDVIAFDYERFTGLLTKFVQDFYTQFQTIVAEMITWNQDQDKSLKKLEDENLKQQKQIDALQKQINKLKK